MTQVLICDRCGEPIDQTQAHYEVNAVKLSVENANDPTQHNVQNTVEIPRTFHFHDGHQPAYNEPEPQPPEREQPPEATQLPVRGRG